jgi:diphosphomevalonate decarboxylase
MEQNKIYNEKDFLLTPSSVTLPGTWEASASAPSNIAFIKYWGKKGLQLPMNASVSFLLPESRTYTVVKAVKLEKPAPQTTFDFTLEGKKIEGFTRKIGIFFERIEKYVPFLKYYHWQFDSKNNFPHSSGIASSASGFAALAKIIVSFEKEFYPGGSPEYYKAKTSFLARLGSGSASRSVGNRIAVWGKHPMVPGSNDLYAIDYPFPVHENFRNLMDIIVLIDEGQKAVSSTEGHRLLEKHMCKNLRVEQARENLTRFIYALKSGNTELFGKIIENEALSLHALMMTSDPNYILMQPGTLKLIHHIRHLRKNRNWPVYFTLDAGANMHLIAPANLFDRLNVELIEQGFNKFLVNYIF